MKDEEIIIIGKYSATLSIVEIGLGSILHAASMPLTGQILSISQMAILSRVSFKEKSKFIPLRVSLVGSILKSLSPAGKKLTPMLAILAQGFFFSVGLVIFGVNYIGLLFAILLSSFWAFIQPLLILYFLFGKTIIDVLNYFKKDFTFITTLSPSIIIKLLIMAYLLKVIIAFIIAVYIIKIDDEKFNTIQSRLNVKAQKRPDQSSSNQLINAFFDLFHPVFIISFILAAIFLFYSESSYVKIIWMLLRPVTLGLIIFYIVRIYPVDKLVLFLDSKGFKNISKSLQVAIDTIKQNGKL